MSPIEGLVGLNAWQWTQTESSPLFGIWHVTQIQPGIVKEKHGIFIYGMSVKEKHGIFISDECEGKTWNIYIG